MSVMYQVVILCSFMDAVYLERDLPELMEGGENVGLREPLYELRLSIQQPMSHCITLEADCLHREDFLETLCDRKWEQPEAVQIMMISEADDYLYWRQYALHRGPRRKT